MIKEFLADLKKEFDKENDRTIKVAELKKVEQGNRIMDNFVQKFKRQQEKVDIRKDLWKKNF